MPGWCTEKAGTGKNNLRVGGAEIFGPLQARNHQFQSGPVDLEGRDCAKILLNNEYS